MSQVPQQCRSAPASRPGLQSGQLHEDTGFAEGGGALVDDDVARQAGEDRGQHSLINQRRLPHEFQQRYPRSSQRRHHRTAIAAMFRNLLADQLSLAVAVGGEPPPCKKSPAMLAANRTSQESRPVGCRTVRGAEGSSLSIRPGRVKCCIPLPGLRDFSECRFVRDRPGQIEVRRCGECAAGIR